jgi:hypothetical protein
MYTCLQQSSCVQRTAARGSVVVMMADEDALTSAARAARKAGPNDRVVEIKKPLGLVLEENEKV